MLQKRGFLWAEYLALHLKTTVQWICFSELIITRI